MPDHTPPTPEEQEALDVLVEGIRARLRAVGFTAQDHPTWEDIGILFAALDAAERRLEEAREVVKELMEPHSADFKKTTIRRAAEWLKAEEGEADA